ncbi:integration host factor subunit alpha [Desulfocurvibacter africanus]|uniref:Integration host factor subunit alpha n=2 Tax=Desulfocurvibacter africanus TaxID=873 RepID=F3YW92_DESAF|nr:histone family protein DNA-binding protein [Desulfocurvibacter africanus subsp. africanus str. Walvis Bay]EMG37430.1 bacterial nucleoid DNA-binding protein [Desulfocurvibacter africanus PCS]
MPNASQARSEASSLGERRLHLNKTLTKAEIVDYIYEKTDLNRAEIKAHVETLLDIMKQSIKRDHSLLISGFGKFEAYDKRARKGRNPQTNETITLPPRKVVVFRLSRKFRGELNGEELED